VVAEVEYESCAEELRLCGSEATLMSPSDILTPAPTDFPSPLPFSKLGVELPRWLYVETIEALDRRVEFRAPSLARGLGGRLLARFGG